MNVYPSNVKAKTVLFCSLFHVKHIILLLRRMQQLIPVLCSVFQFRVVNKKETYSDLPSKNTNFLSLSALLWPLSDKFLQCSPSIFDVFLRTDIHVSRQSS